MLNLERPLTRLLASAAILLLAGGTFAVAQHHHSAMGAMSMPANDQNLPKESGQSAFGAISEIVDMLVADPNTDWSKVNVDALRNHLVDMNNVVVQAQVRTIPLPGGARFEVSGEGPVVASIQRMMKSHAMMTDGMPDEVTTVQETPTGGVMTVISQSPNHVQMIRALGFFGELTRGTHHELHHLMMAKGEMQH